MRTRRTTIKDVAVACGVSLMTVSRALQGKPGVGLEKRREIEKKAEAMGYVPHRMAYMLGQKSSSMTVGVVIPQLANSIFPTILQNIETVLSPNGYRMLLCCSYDNPIKEFHEISALLERQVDGIIWSPALVEGSEKAARLIQEQKRPLVFLDRMIPSIKADAVLVDDFSGAYEAVKHLIEQGMRRIYHLAPRTESYVARERCRGYLAALTDSGVEHNENWILKIGSELPHGREGMELLLNSGLLPEAVFCFNDPLAIGACMVLEEKAIPVPEQIAVVGFSNTIETEIARVPLTTVFQDAVGLGQVAAELLLSRMINPGLKISPRKKTLKTRLIVRNSSLRKLSFTGSFATGSWKKGIRTMTKKTHYAAPGADESFLRPETGGKWAPREIAACAKGDTVWTAWIHRDAECDYPVLCRKDSASNGELVAFEKEGVRYSKPVFIDHLGREAPDVALFSVNRAGEASVGVYHAEIGEDIEIKRVKKVDSVCSSAYHMDALELDNGDIHIVYGGIARDRAGSGVYLVKRIGGTWSEEQELAWPGRSLSRPKLTADGRGNVLLLADAYTDATYSVCWINLTEPASSWRQLHGGDGWNMFPSATADAAGRPWAAWLNVRTVRFEDVAGARHHAMLAVYEGGEWRLIKNDGNCLCADLNLGLLPLERYFGYDGLRRYPRLAALSDKSMLLLWEQQKDEDEIWENLANGYLLGKIVKDGGFSETFKLAERGCCFAFDNKKIYHPTSFSYVAKTTHDQSGNDFVLERIAIADSGPYQPAKTLDWSHWREDDFKGETDQARNIIVRRHGDKKLKLYWGDLHCHSVLSPDAEGEIDELYHFARDIAGLDFVALTDNDFYPPKTLLDSEIRYIADMAAAHTDANFLGMSGYEWTFHRPDAEHSFNHRIIIYPDSERLATARRNEAGGNTEEAFAEYLSRHGYFAFPHHGYWQMLADEPAVEVTAGWGTYIQDADTVFKALNGGSRFSFLGNSDSHRFMPGLSGALTGVFAEALTHDAIIDAIRQGRCFATTGNRTVALFRVNDCFMGGHIQTVEPPTVKWDITPHREFESVKIIRGGQVVHQDSRISGEWVDDHVESGHHWYLLEVKEKGEYRRYPHNVASAWGKYLWTSPIWVDQE